MGLRPIVVDTGDERDKLTKEYGAEAFVDFQKEEDTVKKVIEITDGGAHGVFVTAVQAYPTSLGYLGSRAGAKVMWCVQTTPCYGHCVNWRVLSIGLPPAGKFHIDLDPTALVFRNQSIQGTLVSSAQEIDETLEFARRGTLTTHQFDGIDSEHADNSAGKLHLKPTVVGRSKWNDAVQKLKRGEVAG
jgi:alcohol dehydrogenase, propanol-preferring